MSKEFKINKDINKYGSSLFDILKIYLDLIKE